MPWLRAMLRVVEKLDDTTAAVSSPLHSLNIESGLAPGGHTHLRPRGPRGCCGQPLRGPLSLLLQSADGLTRGAFNRATSSADDDADIEMAAFTAIEDPPAPRHSSGPWILPYLYIVFS
jgi:hypothetical protein